MDESHETKITLKLLVDTSANKVLFAEAGKDFIDFLFHIMSLPAAAIVKLIGLKGMTGSLGELYKSIESLNNDFMLESNTKDSVLNPKYNVAVPLLLLNEAPTSSADIKYYRCRSGNHYSHVTNDPNKFCPGCRNYTMSTEVIYVASDNTSATSSSTSNGFVKGVITYMVMDNLEVKPSSAISPITLLNKFHVKDVGSLVEKEVQVGLDEGLAILKASLETQAVFSAVFLYQSTEVLSTVFLEEKEV